MEDRWQAVVGGVQPQQAGSEAARIGMLATVGGAVARTAGAVIIVGSCADDTVKAVAARWRRSRSR